MVRILHYAPLVAAADAFRHNAHMLMMNRNKLAKLHYMAAGFRILSSGDHVICAVTGETILLDELRYWSVARQEPYVSAEASLRAFQNKG
jgi:hypothetical protein